MHVRARSIIGNAIVPGIVLGIGKALGTKLVIECRGVRALSRTAVPTEYSVVVSRCTSIDWNVLLLCSRGYGGASPLLAGSGKSHYG